MKWNLPKKKEVLFFYVFKTENLARRLEFKKKRKAHYNEGAALKHAKELMEQEMKNIDDDE